MKSQSETFQSFRKGKLEKRFTAWRQKINKQHVRPEQLILLENASELQKEKGNCYSVPLQYLENTCTCQKEVNVSRR